MRSHSGGPLCTLSLSTNDVVNSRSCNFTVIFRDTIILQAERVNLPTFESNFTDVLSHVLKYI